MKLIKLKQEKLVEEKAVAGLVTTKIEYAVEEAKGRLEYLNCAPVMRRFV